jgi:hypothetical protein
MNNVQNKIQKDLEEAIFKQQDPSISIKQTFFKSPIQSPCVRPLVRVHRKTTIFKNYPRIVSISHSKRPAGKYCQGAGTAFGGPGGAQALTGFMRK